MNVFDAETIYGLFPPTVRMRDELAGGALLGLVRVIAEQATIVDENLCELYDDLFIETCAPWAIPYIGDLIGYRPLRPVPPASGPARADVADTIGLRRRKGTLVMLDRLARDVTGWPSVAVEYFARLAVSQYVRNHVRRENACVDVRGYATALEIGGAFDRAPRSADVRRIASARGRYNIPNIGLFVWRLAAYGGATLGLGPAGNAPVGALVATTARATNGGLYTFDPFGDDVALVNPPRTLPAFAIPTAENVPYRLRRFPLYDELEGLRAGTIAPDRAVYFGASPVLAVYDAAGKAIVPQRMAVCDLSTPISPTDPQIDVAVDPERGRLIFNPAFAVPTPVRVSHAYVFSGPYGGGSYARERDPGEASAPSLEIRDVATADPSAWTHGTVEIGDSGIHLGDVEFAPTSDGLVVRAEDDARPIVAGNVTVVARPGAWMTLRGIGIDGTLTIVPPLAPGAAPADPAFALALEHCTVRGRTTWTYRGGGTLTIDHALCAALFVDPTVDLIVSDSVIDAPRPDAPEFDAFPAIAGADGVSDCGNLSLSAATVFGDIRTREIGLIENSIVTGSVVAKRTQTGCVRYSSLPPAPHSLVPPRFRCQPDLAVDAAIASARAQNPALTAAEARAIAAPIEASLVPAFTSHLRGHGGYAQLAEHGPLEIATGAAGADEMGAFHALYNARRESNLRYRLDEYLRVGLEAGIIHAS